MATELSTNIELNDNAEKKSLSLNRVRVELDKDSNILRMDLPSGILLTD